MKRPPNASSLQLLPGRAGSYPPAASEVKFQCKLDQPRSQRRSGKSKLRSSAFSGKVFVGRRGISELQVRMVPDVEELGAELEMHLFFDWKLLDEGQIPILQARSQDGVSSRVSECAQLRVGHKRASIKQRSRQAMRPVRISHHVRTRAIEDLAAAIRIGDVHQVVGRREPIAGLRRDNSGDLPVGDELVGNAREMRTEVLAVPERQIIDKVDDESVAHVEIGVAIFQERLRLQPEVALILRAETGRRRVIERVAVGVGRLKLQAIGKALFQAKLQSVVV